VTLEFKGEGGDKRGKILFFIDNETKINLFEVKKGFARGGHYHDYDIIHTLITGKIEHHVEDVDTKKEEVSILIAPSIMKILAKSANLIVALEDSIFTEVFVGEYKSTVYEKYRSVVIEKMNGEKT